MCLMELKLQPRTIIRSGEKPSRHKLCPFITSCSFYLGTQTVRLCALDTAFVLLLIFFEDYSRTVHTYRPRHPAGSMRGWNHIAASRRTRRREDKSGRRLPRPRHFDFFHRWTGQEGETRSSGGGDVSKELEERQLTNRGIRGALRIESRNDIRGPPRIESRNDLAKWQESRRRLGPLCLKTNFAKSKCGKPLKYGKPQSVAEKTNAKL